MKKWIFPLLIALLFTGSAANGLMYWRQTAVIQGNEALIAGLKADLISINASTGEGITSLNENIQRVAGDISALQGSVGALETNVQTLTGNVSSLSDVVGGLQRTRNSAGLTADFSIRLNYRVSGCTSGGQSCRELPTS